MSLVVNPAANPFNTQLSSVRSKAASLVMAAHNTRPETFSLNGQTHVKQLDGKIEESLIDHVRSNDLFGDGQGYVFDLDSVAEIATSEEFAKAKQQLEQGADEAKLVIGNDKWTAARDSESGDYTLNKGQNGLPFDNKVTLSPEGDKALVKLSGAGYGGVFFSQTLYGESNGSGSLACLDESLLVTDPTMPTTWSLQGDQMLFAVQMAVSMVSLPLFLSHKNQGKGIAASAP